MSFYLYHTDVFFTLFFSFKPAVCRASRRWTQDEISHHTYCSTCFVDRVRYWVSGRTHDTTIKNESLQYATWPWDLWFVVHDKFPPESWCTNKWIVMWYKEVRSKLLQNIPWVMGDNGGKEVNMEQSTLDFWSEFHLLRLSLTCGLQNSKLNQEIEMRFSLYRQSNVLRLVPALLSIGR